MSSFRTALAAEVRAQMAVRKVTAAEIQRSTGMPSANWQKRFVSERIDATAGEVRAVANALGMTGGHLMDLVDARMAAMESGDV